MRVSPVILFPPSCLRALIETRINLFYCFSLFSEQSIEAQSLESLCSQVQKRIPKHEQFNGL